MHHPVLEFVHRNAVVALREHLNLIRVGKTDYKVAEGLSYSQWNIQNHVQATLRKLDFHSRKYAIARVMSLCILHPV